MLRLMFAIRQHRPLEDLCVLWNALGTSNSTEYLFRDPDVNHIPVISLNIASAPLSPFSSSETSKKKKLVRSFHWIREVSYSFLCIFLLFVSLCHTSIVSYLSSSTLPILSSAMYNLLLNPSTEILIFLIAFLIIEFLFGSLQFCPATFKT